MCGITGVISIDPPSVADTEAVQRANARMHHRGPDGSGTYPDADNSGQSNVFLAMRRLSIIDLTGGWQPLYNEDKTLALVANGEIYNSVELRAQLTRGDRHRFRTNSDCEVVLHLYEDYGLECVQQLRGMFAFALWDSRRQRLIIARDRMGEKPLYFYRKTDKLYFASELKSLLATGVVPFRLDAASVHNYLHYGWVPEPETIIEGVRKLPAAGLMTIDVAPWRIAEGIYWRMEDAPAMEGDPGKLIRAELENIANLVIRSDVPVGVALSGGIDSSIIAALAATRYSGKMSAFSVGYPGRPRQDERSQAKVLADQLGMPFHEIELSIDEMTDFFPQLNYWRDEPIADMAGYGYYAVSRKARESGCPVLLQGQGGDELFWGYSWVVRAVEQSLLKQAGQSPNLWSAFAAHLPTKLSKTHGVQLAYLLGGLASGWKQLRPSPAAPNDQLAFYDMADHFQIGAHAADRTYTREFADKVGATSAASMFRIQQPWPRVDLSIMRLLCDSYLRQNGIAQGDRLSMANSVELRLPLVDYKLVELVVGLQKTQPSFRLPAKSWLIDAVKDLVPGEVFRRPKRGFNPPMSPWIGAIKSRYKDDLIRGQLVERGVLAPEAARKLSARNSRFGVWNDLFIKYITLEHWCRTMTAQQLAASPQ